jgi:hypothetical protein
VNFVAPVFMKYLVPSIHESLEYATRSVQRVKCRPHRDPAASTVTEIFI